MSLARVRVRDWQSIEKADLELGGLTVIVGPSNSGKSALVRALRTLLVNGRGAAFVRAGTKTAAVSAVVASPDPDLVYTVALARGASSGAYMVSDGDGAAGTEQTWTKLGGAVPPEVSAFLGVQPHRADLHVAGQFDRPYLLDSSGQETARTLGELTKVSMILRAAQEARRRALAAASTLRLREADLAQCVEQAAAYVGLKGQLDAQAEAEVHLEYAEQQAGMLDRLRATAGALSACEVAATQAREKLEHTAGPEGVAALALALETAYVRWRAWGENTLDLRRCAGEYRAAVQRHMACGVAVMEAEAALQEALERLGECPLCGQEVKHHEHT